MGRQAKALAKKPSMQVTLIALTPEVQVGRQLQPDLFSQVCLLLRVVTQGLYNKIPPRMVKKLFSRQAASRLLTAVVIIVENQGI